MSNYAELDSILDDYLKRPELPFAILIRGEWGVGKTWYINNFCKRFKNDNSNYIICHVSLFGVSSQDEIHRSISASLTYGKLGLEGNYKIGLKLLFDFLSVADDTFIKSIFKRIIPKTFSGIFDWIKSKNIIFVFDDFERNKMDKQDILGVINSYIGNKSKVIILSNENDITNDANEYARLYISLKEKIIGLTLTVLPNYASALKEAINQVLPPKDNIRAIIEESSLSIISIYKENNSKNLRHLSKLIVEFSRLYKSMTDEMRNDSQFSTDILLTCAYLSPIIHSGEHTIKEIRAHISPYNLSSREENGFRIPELLRDAPLVSTSDFWWDFYEHGLISDDLNQHYAASRSQVDIVYRMWKFLDIDDEEFDLLLPKFLAIIDNKEIIEIGKLLHAFGIMITFARENIILKPVSEILQNALDYIHNTELDFSNMEQVLFGNRIDAYAGLMFFSHDTPEFQQITSLVMEKYEELQKSKLAEIIEDIVNSIKANSYEKYQLINIYRNNQNFRRYWMEILSPQKFFETSLEANSKTMREVHYEITAMCGDYGDLQLIPSITGWLNSCDVLVTQWSAEDHSDKRITKLNLDFFHQEIQKSLGKLQKLMPRLGDAAGARAICKG